MQSRNRKLFKRFTIFMLIFIGGVIVYFLVSVVKDYATRDRESNFTVYPGFGIPMPDGYAIHGIDVSRYQKRVNWSVVKKMQDGDIKLGFAFIKATEGVTFTDPLFKRNWTNIKTTKIPRGAYHFMNYRGSGRKQAQNYIKSVKLSSGDLPPVLDVETLGGHTVKEMQTIVAEWLQVIEEYYQVKPIIYTNAAFYNKYLDGKFSSYPLWVAHYLEPHEPRVNRHWHFWQHNEGGRVNGIDAFVDFNVFNGDSVAFRKLLVP